MFDVCYQSFSLIYSLVYSTAACHRIRSAWKFDWLCNSFDRSTDWLHQWLALACCMIVPGNVKFIACCMILMSSWLIGLSCVGTSFTLYLLYLIERWGQVLTQLRVTNYTVIIVSAISANHSICGITEIFFHEILPEKLNWKCTNVGRFRAESSWEQIASFLEICSEIVFAGFFFYH